MKKILSVFLIILMLCLSGCGNEGKLEGTWQAEISYKQLTAGQVTAGFGKFADYIEGFDDIYLTLTYTFSPGGIYTESCDTAAFLDKLNASLKSGIDAYYTNYISENKLKITVADAMKADGISYDELIDESAINAYSEVKGNYKSKDGKLYLSASENTATDENIYTEYVLSGDKLTLKKSVGADFAAAAMLPLELTKVD